MRQAADATDCKADMRVACLTNAAIALNKEKQFDEAIEVCALVLKDDSQNVKALMRRALVLGRLVHEVLTECQAYQGKDMLESAEADLLQASRVDPEGADIKKELAIVRKKLKENAKSLGFKGARRSAAWWSH